MLALALAGLLASGQVSTYVDPKSKEELVLLEHDASAQVFYAAKAGKKRQELKVSGDVSGRIIQVTFPDPSKKYVLEWTAAHDHLKCSNPDGTQQTFDRVDLDRPPFSTPEAAVRALYAQFPPEAQLTKTLNFVEADPSVRGEYLAPKLAEALNAERAVCEAGTECAPGFDVLYDAQDLNVTNLKVSAAGKAHLVTVSFENGGKKTAIKVKTEKDDAGWKVSDLQYPKSESLLELLTAAAAGRQAR